MRTGSFTWLVGIECALLGALMLVAPHQFGAVLYAPLQSHFVEWGGVFLLSGTCLLGVMALARSGVLRVVGHLVAGGSLLALGIDFGLQAAWVSSINYSLLGVATMLVPVLNATATRRTDETRSLFGLTVG